MRLFGLIGYPLGHSRSPEIWNSRFESEGIDARYSLYPLPSVSDVMPLIEGNPSLCGLNVTIPYKRAILPYMHSLSEEAAEAGAVNTILIQRKAGGEIVLKGYNTDVSGFMRAVGPLIEGTPENERTALVLGSGGASQAVCAGLRKAGWKVITVSRSAGKGDLAYSDLTPELIVSSGLIVNATPAGMAPAVNTAPPFPYEYLRPGQVCFDLVYNPEVTLFMRIAAAHGCVVENGLRMLQFQADEAWKIWNGAPGVS